MLGARKEHLKLRRKRTPRIAAALLLSPAIAMGGAAFAQAPGAPSPVAPQVLTKLRQSPAPLVEKAPNMQAAIVHQAPRSTRPPRLQLTQTAAASVQLRGRSIPAAAPSAAPSQITPALREGPTTPTRQAPRIDAAPDLSALRAPPIAQAPKMRAPTALAPMAPPRNPSGPSLSTTSLNAPSMAAPSAGFTSARPAKRMLSAPPHTKPSPGPSKLLARAAGQALFDLGYLQTPSASFDAQMKEALAKFCAEKGLERPTAWTHSALTRLLPHLRARN